MRRVASKISKFDKAFTLIELLVVIAIIGILSSVVFGALGEGREKAKIAHALSSIRELKKTIEVYNIDTGSYPTADCMVEPTVAATCTATTDPFSVSLGVPYWNGPYISLWNLSHKWGGHIGYEYGGDTANDADGDGINDYFIFLDDDAVGTSNADNSGVIPSAALLKIDQTLDDGDLSTGNVRGDGTGWSDQAVAPGEISIKFNAQ